MYYFYISTTHPDRESFARRRTHAGWKLRGYPSSSHGIYYPRKIYHNGPRYFHPISFRTENVYKLICHPYEEGITCHPDSKKFINDDGTYSCCRTKIIFPGY